MSIGQHKGNVGQPNEFKFRIEIILYIKITLRPSLVSTSVNKEIHYTYINKIMFRVF